MQAQAGSNKREGAAPAAVAPVLFSDLGKTRKSVSELRMETSVGVGEKREEGGREEGQSLGLGFGSSSCSSCLPPQKLARTEAFPFRMVAPAPRSSGPTLFYGGSCDAYEAAITLQPLPSALRSPGLGVGAGSAAPAGPRRFSFTPAQWQELQRQAMIYKHFVASVPVPVDLLLSNAISSFPDASPHLLSPNLVGRGGGVCYNLRFGNCADPEPGRCRRTDGKKWRCSRDVAPGQKYCERHVHRGRPRSRKPVELQKAKPITPIDPAATTHCRTTTALDNNPSSRTTTTTLSRPFAVQSTGFLPKSELKLPFLSMEPNMDPRFSEWAKGDGKKTATNEQWELMQPKIVSRSSAIPVLQHYDDQLNLNGTDLNDHCCPFLNPDLSSLGEDSIVDNRDPPRSFIDAWSTEGLTAATSGDRSSVSSAGKLPLSTLSLSMCGFEEDADQVEMGLGVSGAAAKSPHSSWMVPGPLGEVLQSSNVTSPHQGGSSSSKGSCGGGLINLMGKGCCGSQEVSPQESLTTVVSSPTGVLQKAVVSLSDSICCSSPTSAAATSRPEFTLKWISQRKQES